MKFAADPDDVAEAIAKKRETTVPLSALGGIGCPCARGGALKPECLAKAACAYVEMAPGSWGIPADDVASIAIAARNAAAPSEVPEEACGHDWVNVDGKRLTAIEIVECQREHLARYQRPQG